MEGKEEEEKVKLKGDSFTDAADLARRLASFAQPDLPPFADPKDCRAAVITPLGAVGVAQDHREDPEERRSPCQKKEGEGEERGEEKDRNETANRVILGGI